MHFNFVARTKENLKEKAASRFERTKEASIEAIGYICSDVKPELLSAQSNLILTSICSGLVSCKITAKNGGWPRQPIYKKQAQRQVFWLKI